MHPWLLFPDAPDGPETDDEAPAFDHAFDPDAFDPDESDVAWVIGTTIRDDGTGPTSRLAWHLSLQVADDGSHLTDCDRRVVQPLIEGTTADIRPGHLVCGFCRRVALAIVDAAAGGEQEP